MGDNEQIERKAKYRLLVLVLFAIVALTALLLRRLRW